MEQDTTFGGKAVGINLNPGQNEAVDIIKRAAANFIDSFHPADGKFQAEVDGEVIAMKKLALRAAQEAQMWAVKAETWGKN